MFNSHLHTYTLTNCTLAHLHTYWLSISWMFNSHPHTYTLTHLAFRGCSILIHTLTHHPHTPTLTHLHTCRYTPEYPMDVQPSPTHLHTYTLSISLISNCGWIECFLLQAPAVSTPCGCLVVLRWPWNAKCVSVLIHTLAHLHT